MVYDEQSVSGLIRRSADLRSKNRHSEAIRLMEANLAAIDNDCLLGVYEEIFKTAEEVGDSSRARSYSKKLRLLATAQ